MARLTANTVVARPGTADVVALREGDELPDWAEGLVGEHILDADEPVDQPPADEPVESAKPTRAPRSRPTS